MLIPCSINNIEIFEYPYNDMVKEFNELQDIKDNIGGDLFGIQLLKRKNTLQKLLSDRIKFCGGIFYAN